MFPTPIATSTIATQAFRLMELAPLSSFADDTSQARAAAEQYPIALGMCLGAYDWSFARRTAKLARLASLPENWVEDPDLPYVYALPGDSVRLRLVVDQCATWRKEGIYIRADLAEGLTIRDTYLITNEKLLPPEFQTFVSGQLAALLASGPGFVKRVEKVDRIKSDVEGLKQLAIENDTYSGSAHRIDDLPDAGDWVSEALR